MKAAFEKYLPFQPVSLPDRTWPENIIQTAPVWCSVDLRDGKLEVLLVRAPADLMEISDCLRAVQSQKYECDMITFRSASSIRVYADPAMPWTLDGEREEGHIHVDVENVHLAIRLIHKVKEDA